MTPKTTKSNTKPTNRAQTERAFCETALFTVPSALAGQPCQELLKAGVDIRKVSRALWHSSVTITEKYAKWNKAQQGIPDGDLARAWKK